MSKLVDALSLVLFASSAVAFFVGVRAISEQRDLAALYWLVLGALLLRGATELLRPSGAR